MTGIELSPKMADRSAKRGGYSVLAVGNAESVVLLPAAADPPPALNDPYYADVKVKVVSANVNGSRARKGNSQCGGGGGEVGEREGRGAKSRRQQQRSYFDAVFAYSVLV